MSGLSARDAEGKKAIEEQSRLASLRCTATILPVDSRLW